MHFLLGCYLGDGYIAKHPYVHKLTIYQDPKYPGTVNEYMQAMKDVFPRSSPLQFRGKQTLQAYVYSKNIPQLFPQMGVGRKHERPIVMENWQSSIIKSYPFLFLKGLLWTDGCRSISHQGKYEYVQYTFTNKSVDILELFCDTCKRIGVTNTKPNYNKHKIYQTKVCRRDDVIILDTHVGPKY